MAGGSRRRASEPAVERPVELGWPEWADPIAATSLRDGIRTGRFGHAYLLDGPKGVGKTALARAFAQALCCENVGVGDLSQPCSACRACRNVGRRAHPDVEWFSIEAQVSLDKDASETSLSIETVRRLRASTALLPLEAGHRVMVIDDAETLLEPAQQALLKILEEPPLAVTILLLCDDADVLLETVRSRCQTVRVRPVAAARIAQALMERGVKPEEAAEISALSRGAPAWAIAAAEDSNLWKARRDVQATALSWLMGTPYERLVTAFKLGEQFGKRRGEVIGVVLAAVHLLRERMIEASLQGAQDATAAVLGRALAASLVCLTDLDANVRPRLAMEAMVMQWPRLDPIPN